MRNDRQHRVLTLRSTLLCGLLLLAAFACTGSALAAGLVAETTHSVALSDRVFEAGRVELAPAGQSNTQAVLINGRRVGLVFRHTLDRLPQGADASLLFATRDDGVARLIGVQWTDARTGRRESRLFRVAAVSPSGTPAQVARLD